jgi:N-glycosylase/DNA lyase
MPEGNDRPAIPQPHRRSSSVIQTLSSSHAQALAAHLKAVEDFCGEVERLMEARGCIFTEYEGAFAKEEKRKMRSIMDEVYERLEDLRYCLSLPRQRVNRVNAINAYLSELWVSLVKTTSGHLKAYGAVAEDLAALLDPNISAIDEQIQRLRETMGAVKARPASLLLENAATTGRQPPDRDPLGSQRRR